MKRTIFDPAAEADPRDIMNWYDGQRPGLSLEFIREVDGATRRLSDHPQAYRVVWRTTRRVRLKQFPYIVLFQDMQDVIVVLAVLHVRRSPRVYRRRSR